MPDAPTTPILDDFQRANETPLAGPNWVQASTSNSVNLDTNGIQPSAPNQGAVWVRDRMIPNFECYATMANSINIEVLIGRGSNFGAGNVLTSYLAFYFGGLASIVRTPGPVTIARTTINAPIAAGDKLMFRGNGPVLQFSLLSAAAGGWLPPLMVYDTAIRTGYFGVWFGGGAGAKKTNFGGGAYTDSVISIPPAPLGRGATW